MQRMRATLNRKAGDVEKRQTETREDAVTVKHLERIAVTPGQETGHMAKSTNTDRKADI